MCLLVCRGGFELSQDSQTADRYGFKIRLVGLNGNSEQTIRTGAVMGAATGKIHNLVLITYDHANKVMRISINHVLILEERYVRSSETFSWLLNVVVFYFIWNHDRFAVDRFADLSRPIWLYFFENCNTGFHLQLCLQTIDIEVSRLAVGLL